MNIPSRDIAKTITNISEVFYCTETEVEGFKVEMYDYRLASFKDFKDNDAYELRGLTYVYDPLINIWERHIALNKFFNVNQNDEWMIEDLICKKIIRVQEKMDGSMITFVKFPTGVIRAKSKMSFESDQAKMAQELYDTNENIRHAVGQSILNGETLIWELISPRNQIVIDYDKTELVVLQGRENSTGRYLTKSELFRYVECFELSVTGLCEVSSLEDYMKTKEIIENIEGWVITFDDGQMAKVKTKWYMERHGIFTALREDDIIKLTLDEEIDDVISSLTGERKVFTEKVAQICISKFNHLVTQYKELRRKYFQDFKENRKAFSIKYSKDPLFKGVMKELDASFAEVEQIAEKRVKEYILKQTNTLTRTRNWIEE